MLISSMPRANTNKEVVLHKTIILCFIGQVTDILTWMVVIWLLMSPLLLVHVSIKESSSLQVSIWNLCSNMSLSTSFRKFEQRHSMAPINQED